MNLDVEAAERLERRMRDRGQEIPSEEIGGVHVLSIGNMVRLPAQGSPWLPRRHVRSPIMADIQAGVMHKYCKCPKDNPAFRRIQIIRGLALGYRYCRNCSHRAALPPGRRR